MKSVIVAAVIVLASLDICHAFGSVHPHSCRSIVLSPSLQCNTRIKTQTNLYRKFHDYGWDKLLVDRGISDIDTVPEELQTNTSPAKGAPDGTNVVVDVHSISQFPFLENDDASSDNNQVLRLARSAFLETQSSTEEAVINPMTIHVLNFVLFPSPYIRDSSSENYLGLPIFGADIVSLPGNKHLVALDFQPVLPISNNDSNGKIVTSLIPQQYSQFESKLQKIHAKYQKRQNPLLAWGGDIPEQAERFFSPYALWTRLVDDNAIDTVNKVVWEAFQEYTNLYFDLMTAVQNDLNTGKLEVVEGKEEGDNSVRDGQLEYLEYRRTNDPARPMLQRLYGNEWSESVIGDVLFPDI